jgi:hypothetical protein
MIGDHEITKIIIGGQNKKSGKLKSGQCKIWKSEIWKNSKIEKVKCRDLEN